MNLQRFIRHTLLGQTDGEPTPSNDEPLDELLTNEERVVRLLERAGGTMMQTDIVESADWSKSTVSRVLCRMEDEGDVVRCMVGGRNIVYLPGSAPESLRSLTESSTAEQSAD